MESSSNSVSDDRISGLPSNVVDCILDSMTIRDAARTSILSRTWRYIWTTNPKIVFDYRFFRYFTLRGKIVPKVVNEVLLSHNGPIRKFFLYIPSNGNDLSSEVDQWLLFLSKNGIHELELANSKPNPYKLPSCIFSCKTLTHLILCNCILKPPHEFRGFHNLVRLDLVKFSFAPNVFSTLLLNALSLRWLTFRECTGIEHLRFHAPNLFHVCVVASYAVDCLWFESNQQLEIVHLELCKEVENTNQWKTMKLVKFIGNMPRICNLWLDGFALKFLAAGEAPERLPTPAENMMYLRLCNFAVSDSDQISCSLCLLNSSPNLEKLEIHIADMKENTEEAHAICFYLEAPIYKDMKLDKLKTVKIVFKKGHEAELLLVKLLLACSRTLERMYLELSTEIDVREGYRVSREVLRFTRASKTAEVIFSDPR